MENSRLSICIPTFNRADLLKENLLDLIDIIKSYNIPVYISDNCSTDHTEPTVIELKREYEHIHYFKQTQNIGDDNFPFVLRQSSTDYAWLLGDKLRIKPESFSKILDILEHDIFDAIIVNADWRVKNMPSQIYRNHNRLLVDLGWHMTLISSLIFSKELIHKINFERYNNTNFMHVSGIFEAIANRDFKILWIDDPMILEPKTKTKSGWVNQSFKIFIEIWANSIFSLPPTYAIESKLKCIKKHGIESQVFSIKNFLRLRKHNVYNLSIFKKYRKIFQYFTNVPNFVLFLISIVPKFIIRFE